MTRVGFSSTRRRQDCELVVRRSEAKVERALATSASPQLNVMKMHHLLAHSSEHITTASAKASGIMLTEEWKPCVECNRSRAHRYAVPRSTNNRTSEQAVLLYIDLVGLTEPESAGDSSYTIFVFNDYSRFKVKKFFNPNIRDARWPRWRATSPTTSPPAKLTIHIIHTDNGKEFEGHFSAS